MEETYQNIWELPKETWESVILESETFAEIARKMNKVPGSGFNDRLRNYCKKHNILLDKFNQKAEKKNTKGTKNVIG